MKIKSFTIKNYKGNLLESVENFSKKYPNHKILEVKESDGVLKLKAQKLLLEYWKSDLFTGDVNIFAEYYPTKENGLAPAFGIPGTTEVYLYEIDMTDPEEEEIPIEKFYARDCVPRKENDGKTMLQYVYDNECDKKNNVYFIAIPDMKAPEERDPVHVSKNKYIPPKGGLEQEQKLLLQILRDKYAIALIENLFYKTGKLAFCKVKDEHKPNPPVVYTFKDWDMVEAVAYLKD